MIPNAQPTDEFVRRVIGHVPQKLEGPVIAFIPLGFSSIEGELCQSRVLEAHIATILPGTSMLLNLNGHRIEQEPNQMIRILSGPLRGCVRRVLSSRDTTVDKWTVTIRCIDAPLHAASSLSPLRASDTAQGVASPFESVQKGFADQLKVLRDSSVWVPGEESLVIDRVLQLCATHGPTAELRSDIEIPAFNLLGRQLIESFIRAQGSSKTMGGAHQSRDQKTHRSDGGGVKVHSLVVDLVASASPQDKLRLLDRIVTEICSSQMSESIQGADNLLEALCAALVRYLRASEKTTSFRSCLVLLKANSRLISTFVECKKRFSQRQLRATETATSSADWERLEYIAYTFETAVHSILRP